MNTSVCPNRLMVISASHYGVLPLPAVKLAVCRRLGFTAKSQQRAESIKQVEAPVEAKREFVEIGLKVLRRNPVMATAQPTLQVRKDEVHDWQVLFRNIGIVVCRCRKVFISKLGELGIATPAIRDDHRFWRNGAFYKAGKRLGRAIGHNLQAKASGISPAPARLRAFFRLTLANLDCRRDKGRIVVPASLAFGRAADPDFIDFDVADVGSSANSICVWPNHSRPQLVQDLESRLVALQAELSLELERAHASRVCGDEVRSPEPYAEWGMGPLHDGASHQARISAALPAAQNAGACRKPERLADCAARGTDKLMFPTAALKIGSACPIVRKELLEFRQRFREHEILALVDVEGRR
jgi:hypothetical protein